MTANEIVLQSITLQVSELESQVKALTETLADFEIALVEMEDVLKEMNKNAHSKPSNAGKNVSKR